MEKTFQINADLHLNGKALSLTVEHTDETFTLSQEGQKLGSILNNCDNTWQLVEGTLAQEQVNLLGEEIEKHYRNIDPLS